jgi:hypothetical protein
LNPEQKTWWQHKINKKKWKVKISSYYEEELNLIFNIEYDFVDPSGSVRQSSEAAA